MLVISPTRELAAQIAEEAKQITAFQQNFRVQVRLCAPHCSPKSAHCMMQARVSLFAQIVVSLCEMETMSAGCAFGFFSMRSVATGGSPAYATWQAHAVQT